MAISVDAVSSQTFYVSPPYNTVTVSHTISGIEGTLWVNVLNVNYPPYFGDGSLAYWDGNLMTEYINTKYNNPNVFANIQHHLYYIQNPTTGTHDITVDWGAAEAPLIVVVDAVSYNGVLQSDPAFIDNYDVKQSGPSTTFTQSVAVGSVGCWILAGIGDFTDAVIPDPSSAGCILRVDGSSGNGIFDTDGTVAIATRTFNVAVSSSQYWGGLMVAFKPTTPPNSGSSNLAAMGVG